MKPDRFRVITDMIDEYDRAVEKHPVWPGDVIHMAAIVMEEAGEMMRAAVQYEHEGGWLDEVERELIQVGAMAIRMSLEIQKNRWSVLNQDGLADLKKVPGASAPKSGVREVSKDDVTRMPEGKYHDSIREIIDGKRWPEWPPKSPFMRTSVDMEEFSRLEREYGDVASFPSLEDMIYSHIRRAVRDAKNGVNVEEFIKKNAPLIRAQIRIDKIQTD